MSQFSDLAAVGYYDARGQCRHGCRMWDGMSYLDAANALYGGRVVYLGHCCVFLLSDGVDMIGLLNAADC